MNIGDKILGFRNIEDITSAYVIEIEDVYEVSNDETYYELLIKSIDYVT